jgi:hypothetical protein
MGDAVDPADVAFPGLPVFVLRPIAGSGVGIVTTAQTFDDRHREKPFRH